MRTEKTQKPHSVYCDVVIVSGAIMAVFAAWFLSDIPDFDNTVQVVARRLTCVACSAIDHNTITGPQTEVKNTICLNGFPGDGLQKAPAMGRGTADWIACGGNRALDLTPANSELIPNSQPNLEKAII